MRKEARRAALLRDMKAWALSRSGMDDPEARPALMRMAAKADERLKAIDDDRRNAGPVQGDHH